MDGQEDNLLVAANGDVKIADFGTAAKIKPGELLYSKMGTPVILSRT